MPIILSGFAFLSVLAVGAAATAGDAENTRELLRRQT